MTCCCLRALSVRRLFDDHHLVQYMFCCLFLTSIQGIRKRLLDSVANPTSPQHSLRLSSQALQPKWRERNHHKALCNDFGSWAPNWPFSNSASSLGFSELSYGIWTVSFSLPNQVLSFRRKYFSGLGELVILKNVNQTSFSCKQRWKLRWKPLNVPGSYSVPFCLNLHRRRSSSLAGMFSIALDSFSELQNFFHAFKSLLVLYWVFFDFCSCKNFLISTSSLLVVSRKQICQRLLVFFTCFLVTVYWFSHLVLLTGTSQVFHILCL